MTVNIETKYKFNDIVKVKFNNCKPNEISKGIITDLKIYQSRHYREDAFIISYLICPLEFEGFEHDESEWIIENSILNVKGD